VYRLVIGLAVGLWLFPSVGWGQSNITDSFQIIKQGAGGVTAQMFKCDESAPANTPAGGEDCESGDWSTPINVTGLRTVTVEFTEYGAGSMQLFIWSCRAAPGAAVLGTVAPAADATNFCSNITASADFDGTTVTSETHVGAFDWIILEVQDCTPACDATAVLSASP
jgi:hypothetical protein